MVSILKDAYVKEVGMSRELLDAAIKGDVQKVDALLQSGADIDTKDIVNCRPLHHAAQWGRIDVVKLLIEKGAEVNAKDIGGGTALHIVISAKDTVVGGFSPDHLGVAKHLIGSGAEVNAKDMGGNTPLHLAALYGEAQVALLLIEAGADVNLKNTDDKQRPLRIALKRGNSYIADLLKKHGGKK